MCVGAYFNANIPSQSTAGVVHCPSAQAFRLLQIGRHLCCSVCQRKLPHPAAARARHHCVMFRFLLGLLLLLLLIRLCGLFWLPLLPCSPKNEAITITMATSNTVSICCCWCHLRAGLLLHPILSVSYRCALKLPFQLELEEHFSQLHI